MSFAIAVLTSLMAQTGVPGPTVAEATRVEPSSVGATPARADWDDPLLKTAVAVILDPEKAKDRVLALAKARPDDDSVKALSGLWALCSGDLRTARAQLPEGPRWAVYRAMAEVDRPGAMGRINEILARAARTLEPPAGVLFMAGLAYGKAKKPDRSHALLRRAFRAEESVLSESFAPDPVVAVGRLAMRAAPAEAREAASLAVAAALVKAGRRGEGRRLVDGVSGANAAYVRWASWDGVDARRAVAAARSGADTQPELALVVAESNFERGRSAVIPDEPLHDPTWEARRDRLRAKVALKAKQAAEALDAARAAARAEPTHDAGVALVVEAMAANGETGRAKAFAKELLSRRPLDVNPYRALLRVSDDEPEQARKLTTLRSLAWERQQARLRSAKARRERVLAAARDADGGLGATGLEALRLSEPELGLAADLALAKHGSAGVSRAARERVVSRCAPHLLDWLKRRGDWSHATVRISPYGEPVKARATLSDPDPGRCPGATLRVGRGRL